MSTSDIRGGRNTSNARATGQQRSSTAATDTARRANKPIQSNNSTGVGHTNAPNEETTLPVFNVEDVERLLAKGITQQSQAYTVGQQSAPTKASPWGTKCAMANGRDFWLELRKQVTALRQSGGVSQGG